MTYMKPIACSDYQSVKPYLKPNVEKKTEMYLCQSYWSDNDKLVACTCGKCAEAFDLAMLAMSANKPTVATVLEDALDRDLKSLQISVKVFSQTCKEEIAKRNIERDPDLEYCEICGGVMRAEWENNGLTVPDPTHFEISGWKCDFCGSRK